MKAIVLAAGSGTRLAPYTDTVPKAMVPLRGRPILDYALGNLMAAGIRDIAVVTGYMAESVAFPGQPVRYYHNPRFASTNMIHSLFCAEPFMDGPMVISYGDIVYSPTILKALLDEPSEVAVAVDDAWLDLWKARNEDPLQDAETMKIDERGFITEVGAKPKGIDQIDSQYIGLLKFGPRGLALLKEAFHALDKEPQDRPYFRGRIPAKLFFTDMLQLLADRHPRLVKAVRFQGGWLEVDTAGDYELFNAPGGAGDRFCDFAAIPRLPAIPRPTAP